MYRSWLTLQTKKYRAFGEWRLLIFDGFGSHLDLGLIEYCLAHKILPFCLPAHTSHILQPLDVSIFSPMKTYYGQEVNNLRVSVDKDLFPNLLARARTKAFTSHNVKAGFHATGIHPYNPHIILHTLSLPEPSLPPPQPIPPISLEYQTPQDLLTYRPATPTTPQSIHNLYVEGLATINSNSPRSIKQRTIFTKFKRSAERNAASVVMHEAGEAHLREEIKQMVAKGKADKRQLNSNAACILERGDTLAEMKRHRDEKDAEKENRKRQKKAPPPSQNNNQHRTHSQVVSHQLESSNNGLAMQVVETSRNSKHRALPVRTRSLTTAQADART
jgi:hypothetical protein